MFRVCYIICCRVVHSYISVYSTTWCVSPKNCSTAHSSLDDQTQTRDIMPEGPELCLNSLLVNRVCEGRVFTGGVAKSAVSKSCDVPFTSTHYTITSEARGKEMALILQCLERAENRLRILFRFGMSGRFRFGSVSEVPKHTHLQFFTNEQPQNVLCFVDVRRFGSWHLMEKGWGEERGPDPMYEYEEFRKNILENLEDSAFNRPICEAMLNQKYFNGVGNYLRAEILYR